jgi:hypothetical protein
MALDVLKPFIMAEPEIVDSLGFDPTKKKKKKKKKVLVAMEDGMHHRYNCHTGCQQPGLIQRQIHSPQSTPVQPSRLKQQQLPLWPPLSTLWTYPSTTPF